MLATPVLLGICYPNSYSKALHLLGFFGNTKLLMFIYLFVVHNVWACCLDLYVYIVHPVGKFLWCIKCEHVVLIWMSTFYAHRASSAPSMWILLHWNIRFNATSSKERIFILHRFLIYVFCTMIVSNDRSIMQAWFVTILISYKIAWWIWPLVFNFSVFFL